jgi:hydroxymethylbilane synthase
MTRFQLTRKITIGTRGSQLALWQTRWVKAEIEKHHRDIEVDIKIISTKGDRVLDVSLPKLGEQGKGLFTKELEDAILAGRVDIAVHSLKDLPTELPAGLQIGAICEREDPRDALVARAGVNSFQELPQGAVIGTSSLRRQAQLRAARPDLELIAIRGNVDTRLRKLDEGGFDAIVLAAAGLDRLGHADRITQHLSDELVLPAVGQGALAIETRADDAAIDETVRALDHTPTRLACTAERAFLRGLGGGCLVPIAAHAKIEAGVMTLNGLVASADGSEVMRDRRSGRAEETNLIGEQLAKDLLARGAGRILSSIEERVTKFELP